MDEKQIETLAERIFLKLKKELGDARLQQDPKGNPENFPKAYIILPEKTGQNVINKTIDCLRLCKGQYETIVVAADETEICDELNQLADRVMTRKMVHMAAGESMTIFISASRNLRVRTALCLGGDFESDWALECIENCRPLYMLRAPQPAENQPEAYRNKIKKYDQELESFGVFFDRLPSEKRQNCAPNRENRRKQIITAEDIKKMPCDEDLFLRQGDLVTELGRELAQEKRIRIMIDKIKKGGDENG